MKLRTKRRLLDVTIGMFFYIAINAAGAGYWALLIFPFGLWNYWDGLTRQDLPP